MKNDRLERMVDFIMTFDEKSIDPKYKEYLSKVRAMTGPGIIQLLNGVCKFIDFKGCYLEIGTHRGSTLIGAALDDRKTMYYGVDTFEGHNGSLEAAPFATIEEGLIDALDKLTFGNVQYFRQDYLEFFESKTNINGHKVQVYFYDGDHRFENQYLGLYHCVDVLDDEAIVLVDDSANNDRTAVLASIAKIMADDYRFSFLREFKPKRSEIHGDFWCGLIALKFERNT